MKLISPIKFALPLSIEQGDVASSIDAGFSVAVDACAGSGKTHTANYITYNYAEGVELIPFARSLREEQSTKFNDFPWIKVSNFHQRGKRLLGNCRVDPKKVANIATNLYGPLGRKIAGLVTAAKTEGYGTYPDALPMDSIAVKYGFRLTEKEEESEDLSLDEMAVAVLELSDKDRSIIDYEDMLRLPVIYGRAALLPITSLIVLDEVQDFRPDAFVFIRECLVTPEHQVLMIGDPSRQALMQFAGATPDLFDVMADYFGCIRKSLTENRRCAKAIVSAAPFKGDMVALSDAPEGEVTSMSEDDVIASICDGMYSNDAMLCETNAPIVTLGIKLLTSGVPVRMRTNKLDSMFFSYAYKYIVDKTLNVGEMSIRLQDDLAERAMNGADVTEFADFIKCVEALENYCLANGILKSVFRYGKPSHPLQQALAILTSGGSGITLMTGHTAKGLEWNTVFHLPANTKASEQDWQVHQSQCLAHVISTRAKSRFVTLIKA